MPDGKIVFSTKIDNANVDKDLKRLEQKIRQAEESISKNRNAKLPLVNQANELGAKLDEAKAKAQMLQEEMAAINSAMAPGSAPDDYAAASADLPRVQEALKEQEKEVAALQKQWDGVNNKIDAYDSKIKAAQDSIAANTAKADELSATMTGSGAKMAEAFATARAAAARFEQRIISLGKRILVFSVIASAFRAIKNYMDQLLSKNQEYTAQLAELKSALATAFQPIYEYILPGLMAVLRVLTSIVLVVANVLSALGGKTLGQSSKNAKALNEEADAIGAVGGAAKDAKKELAGFDEINTLGSPDSGGGGGGAGGSTSDFVDFDTAEYKAKIDELTVYLSGALLALGAILAFSGANIPLGIGLMAAGAIGLASVVKANWGAIDSDVKGAVQRITVLLGAAALALGAILAFTGIKVGLGLALIGIGAASMVGAAMINWNSMPDALKSPLAQIFLLASAAMLALGLVLALSGINVPLGIALIAASAVGMVSVGALNWNAIQERLSSVWAGIKQWFTTHVQPKLTLSYWQGKFSTIADALVQKIRDGVNTGIALFNRFISWINQKMRLSWGDFSVLGEKVINAGTFQLLTLPQIPMLAQGAVLPANKPFLAMVGDQKNGTNVEAPLETIKQALAEVMAMYGGDGDIVIRFEGDLAQLARVLAPVITRENKRVGPSLAGGNT